MNPTILYPASLIALSLVLVGGLLVAVGRVSPGSVRGVALGLLLILGATGGAAAAGGLSFETVPPTMLVAIVAVTIVNVLFVRGAVGFGLATGLPLAVLVGFQAFRIPVELWLHRGYELGLFPVQMTYSGLNFDILSGISATAVAVAVHQGWGGRKLVLAWNVVALGLLATIVTIALLSAPLPFRQFTEGPPNTYVTGFPGVWLPIVLVQAALLGHLLVFRRLRVTPPASKLPGPPAPRAAPVRTRPTEP